jgi:hypothetical protein
VRELRLRDESARLKRLVAHLTLDRHVLQEVDSRSLENPQAPRYRPMDPRMLPVVYPPLLQVELSRKGYVVLPLPSARRQSLATTDARARHCQPRFSYKRPHILLTREGWVSECFDQSHLSAGEMLVILYVSAI